MNVITNRSAIGRGVFVPKYRNVRQLAERNRHDVRNQVGFRFVVFAATRRRAGGVEVPERHGPKSVGPIVARENLFHHELGPTVGICGLLWMLLVKRTTRRLAIGCAGRRKNKLSHAGRKQHLEHRDSLLDVVFKISFRIGNRFRNFGKRGKVNAGLNVVLATNPFDQVSVAGAASVEDDILIQRRAMSTRQIIQHNRLLPCLGQQINHHAADVARAARHKNSHRFTRFTLPYLVLFHPCPRLSISRGDSFDRSASLASAGGTI